jgi:hypothetical protein
VLVNDKVGYFMFISLLRISLGKAILLISLLSLTACDSGGSGGNNSDSAAKAPVVTEFSATEMTITSGDSTNITAIFENGTGEIDNGVGSVVSNRPVTVTPTSTTTFQLTVTNDDSEAAVESITITVLSSPPPLPVITSFIPSETTITQGHTVDLTAIFENGEGTIDNGVGSITSNQTVTVSPSITSTYKLTVSNAVQETTTQSITITVLPLPNPTVTSFLASNTTITEGDSITLTPIFENGTGSIDNGVGIVASNEAKTIIPNVTTTYTLTVTNAAMVTVSDSVTVTVQAAGMFSLTTGTPMASRIQHSATLLKTENTNGDGHVLIAGGRGGGATLNSAELYNPVSGLFTATASVMNSIRRGHTATLLANGKVLIAGGDNTASGNTGTTNTAELYDPVAKTFTSTGSMNIGHYQHTATLLANGNVLIIGGFTGGPGKITISNRVEVYNPTTGQFSNFANNLKVARSEHRATVLDNGQILITGGSSPSDSIGGSDVASVELFDPSNSTFTLIDAMSEPRSAHSAVKLTDGTVLVQNGSSAEVYDPTKNIFNATGNPIQSPFAPDAAAALLPNGKILIVGFSADSKDAQLYNSVTNEFSLTANAMREQHFIPTVTRLHNDEVLIFGNGSAELYK